MIHTITTEGTFSGLLADSAARLLSQQYSLDRRRQTIAAQQLDRAMWSTFAEMGWLGLLLDEQDGGLGQSIEDASPILRALGRHLVAEPYVDLVVVAGHWLSLSDFHARATWLGGLASGQKVVAPAHYERGMPSDLAPPKMQFEGGKLNGSKHRVAAGACADAWIVTAQDAGTGRARAWLVPSDADGVRLHAYAAIDGMPLADLAFAGVRVTDTQELRMTMPLADVLANLHARGLTALCQEAVGLMEGMHALTLNYVKIRRQFGSVIGRFQAIQHRLVDMYARLELARTVADHAVRHAGAGTGAATELSACKVQVARSCRFVGEQGVQLHGGIGMTDECAASHYFRRLLVTEKKYGDAAWHLRLLVEAQSRGETGLLFC